MVSLNSTVSSLYGFPPSAAFAFRRLNDLKIEFTYIMFVVDWIFWAFPAGTRMKR